MSAITDLFKSERGILTILLVIAAGILAGLGRIPSADYLTYSKWIFVTYTAGKSVTGAVQILKGGTADPEQAATTNSTSTSTPTSTPVPAATPAA
jgi:hypothetical protein